MKKNPAPESGAFRLRVLFAFVLCTVGVFLALVGFGAFTGSSALAQDSGSKGGDAVPTKPVMQVGYSLHNDVSPALRTVVPWPVTAKEAQREANLNPLVPDYNHVDSPDPVVQNVHIPALGFLAPAIPMPIRNFDGIPFPGVGCNCAPPDTNGAVGTTQYVQMVNEAYQVFDKNTGASVLGPNGIQSIWQGFGGVCETSGSGDPIVMFDRIANRWVITQFAGSPPTHECIAVSTTADATGTYNRYDFLLGTNFFDYPHLAVWPDGYYMADNVFNAAGTAFLGTQAFVFDRAKMLAGLPATFQTPGLTPGSPSTAYFLPADFDGTILPTAGAPATFVETPRSTNGNTYRTWHYHVDFVTPANSTFTIFANPAAAAYTNLCAGNRVCVPALGGTAMDAIGDRLMHRLAYRKFADGHEAVVGNHTVSSGGVAGIRWFELRNVTAGPVTVFQQSTYQPDTTWRWMGSAAMDKDGNMALGFSASSSTINPQIRYAGRLATDPLNTLGQGEATLFAGTGSQTGTGSRWGDYSAMTIDPVDDQTFWYTQEYYATTGSFNWRTRIGSFKFSTVPTNSIIGGGSSVVVAGANGVLDPGEIVTVSLGLKNNGGPGSICTTSALTGTLQATGGVTAPSGPQVYGVACNAAGPAIFKNFTFTVNPALACGGTVTATLAVTDGATNYGTVPYVFTTGSVAVASTQNFDGVVAPALPAGWTTTATGGATPWVTSTTTPNSAPNAAFASDIAVVTDIQLVSSSFVVSAGGARLSFKNNFITEPGFDGMVLEISIAGGAYADIITAGGTFVSGGYTGVISTAFASPIAGRQAWNGNSGGYITSTVTLPPAANGQNVQLKWRMATDNSVAATGVRIDDVQVSVTACGGSAPVAASIVSRHLHGAVPFDIPMPLGSTSTSGVECRRGTGAGLNNHQLRLTFPSLVSVGSATVTSSDGLATAAPSVAGTVVTVDLAAVADAQILGVTLSAVSDGVNLGNINIPMGVLLGDVNTNRATNGGDTTITRSRAGLAVDATTFFSDVNLDGFLNGGDTTIVRGRSGNALP